MKMRTSAIKEKLKNNKLLSNFFYLSIVQVVSLLIPLVVTPYLVQVLGLKGFGLITFAQSIMLLLNLLVDFGFNVSATREISINRDSKQMLSLIISEVMVAKLLLLAVAFAIFIFLLFLPRFNSFRFFYLTSFLIIIGQAFLPTWIYQGLEKIRDFAYINVACRLLYLFLLFVIVENPTDFIWVNVLWGGSFLLSTLISLLHLKFRFGIWFVKPSITGISQQIRNAIHLFFTAVSINAYTYINSTVLGFFVGYEAVGLYSIAERVMMVLKQAPMLFSQVLFPAGCKAASESLGSYQRILRNNYTPFIILFFAICLAAFFFTPEIALYFYHSRSVQLEIIINVFIAAVLITSLNIPAYQTLLSFNFHKSYSFTLMVCCLISIISNIFLTSFFGIKGTTANVFFTEVFVTVALYGTLHLRHRSYSLLNRRSYV